jgi:hypothetical protein
LSPGSLFSWRTLGLAGQAVRGSGKERKGSEPIKTLSDRQSLNGRQMEEIRLPLLTGGRSRGVELSKDRSLDDSQPEVLAPQRGAQGLGEGRGQPLPSAYADPLQPRARGAGRVPQSPRPDV